ncbi:MAG: hypothetical protein MUO76_14295 [Anaerolineaceae bacterium]|nr:hypothetical protein [Anaerolineaceae bacterium]
MRKESALNRPFIKCHFAPHPIIHLVDRDGTRNREAVAVELVLVFVQRKRRGADFLE